MEELLAFMFVFGFIIFLLALIIVGASGGVVIPEVIGRGTGQVAKYNYEMQKELQETERVRIAEEAKTDRAVNRANTFKTVLLIAVVVALLIGAGYFVITMVKNNNKTQTENLRIMLEASKQQPVVVMLPQPDQKPVIYIEQEQLDYLNLSPDFTVMPVGNNQYSVTQIGTNQTKLLEVQPKLLT
jgi:hypothetical protein